MLKRSMTIYINEADNGFTVTGYINQNEYNEYGVGTAQCIDSSNQSQIQFSLIAQSVGEAADIAKSKLDEFQSL